MGLQSMQQQQEQQPLNQHDQLGQEKPALLLRGSSRGPSAGSRGMRLIRLLAAIALAGTWMQVDATPLQEGSGLKRFAPWNRPEELTHAPTKAIESQQQQQQPSAALSDQLEDPLARQIDLIRFLLKNREALERELQEEENKVDDEEEVRKVTKEEARRWIALQKQRKMEELQRLRQEERSAGQQQVEEGGRPKRRGSCLFHAGLAHNCDYRDVVGAVNEASHWGSALAPGKRRR